MVGSKRGPAEDARRLRRMGLEVEELPECAVATLRLGPEPFGSSDGPLRIDLLRFATVGGDRIKCLEPEALFHLPLLSIRGCASAEDLEARVRRAWGEQRDLAERARRWLEELGGSPTPLAAGAAYAIGLGLEDAEARAVASRPGRVVVPGRGPLSGIALHRASDRVQHVDGCRSAADLAIAVTTRLEELARDEGKRARMRATAAARRRAPEAPAQRGHPVLLVGGKLAADRALAESLKLRGHTVDAVASLRDALARFGEHSFELVLVDCELGRSEGAELIPSLESVHGLAHVPVLMVDDRSRAARRKAARNLGAAGYLVRPLSLERIDGQLERLLDAPSRRRFQRYPHRLAVRFAGGTRGGSTCRIGRGGMALLCERAPEVGRLDRFDISLPDTREVVNVEAEVVYERTLPGRASGEFGVRFASFPPGHERSLIAWLAARERAPATP